MMNPNPRRRCARLPHARLVLTLVAAWACPAAKAQAAGVLLTASDVALSVYSSSDGTTWHQLTSGALAGFFGAHRCLCPDILSPVLSLTSSGQANIGTSTISVNFLLGANCLTAPASCVALGQVAFSASQSATSPQFDSSLVFQSAAKTSAVNCAGLTAGSTTLWAVVAQDGAALAFVPAVALSISTAAVAAPTAVTALAADKGIQVSWTPPADTSLVAGYQVLCLPRPVTAAIPGYESCGLATSVDGGIDLTPADISELCNAEVSASTTQVRLSGLVNGTTYTVAVIAIDPSGGVSALSPPGTATPGPTTGFYDKYKQAGGAASGCAITTLPHSGRTGVFWIVIAVALAFGRGQRSRRGKAAGHLLSAILILAFSTPAQAQIRPGKGSDDWAVNPAARDGIDMPPDWGFEVGLSLYRPAVDSEFGGAAHPYADTFGTSRHIMSEIEVDRYLGHGLGSWGVGMRIGYQKLTGSAFMSDGITRSGDETGLRLLPFSVSAFYKADGLPGLRSVPLVPYVKAGLDGVVWTETTTGGKASHSGLTPGWHATAGLALGLNTLGLGAIRQGAIAGPGSLFFEWDYAKIDGLGFGGKLHVGDSTWVAGLMFDL